MPPKKTQPIEIIEATEEIAQDSEDEMVHYLLEKKTIKKKPVKANEPKAIVPESTPIVLIEPVVEAVQPVVEAVQPVVEPVVQVVVEKKPLSDAKKAQLANATARKKEIAAEKKKAKSVLKEELKVKLTPEINKMKEDAEEEEIRLLLAEMKRSIMEDLTAKSNLETMTERARQQILEPKKKKEVIVKPIVVEEVKEVIKQVEQPKLVVKQPVKQSSFFDY
jgi:hypothetical protein